MCSVATTSAVKLIVPVVVFSKADFNAENVETLVVPDGLVYVGLDASNITSDSSTFSKEISFPFVTSKNSSSSNDSESSFSSVVLSAYTTLLKL